MEIHRSHGRHVALVSVPEFEPALQLRIQTSPNASVLNCRLVFINGTTHTAHGEDDVSPVLKNPSSGLSHKLKCCLAKRSQVT